MPPIVIVHAILNGLACACMIQASHAGIYLTGIREGAVNFEIIAREYIIASWFCMIQ
jgi:hypothetical protein